MGIKLTNNANATLAAGIDSSATSITLTSGQGARFPTLAGGDYFYATLVDTSNNLEIVKCTARSTDVLTVVRAQESTTARAYVTGDRIEIRLTAQTFLDAVAEIGPTQVSDELNSSTGYFQVAKGTTAQRPGSPATGMVRFNTDLNYLEEYRASGWLPLSNVFSATGGTETTSGGYKYHTFTSSGTFTVQSGTANIEYLVVAGGGGGGSCAAGDGGGGGAGAGGYIATTLTPGVQAYTVTVGAGGSGSTNSANNGANGNNSSFSASTATAGGGAGSTRSGANGNNGGSGGGAGSDSGGDTGGTGTSGQGNNGGNNTTGQCGAGGGGASAAGVSVSTGLEVPNGGNGSTWLNGSTYAGGGGGGKFAGGTNAAGAGGTGGGGAGGKGTNGSNGTANTGGGGGGGGMDGTFRNGGNGGSGIVIIRYTV